MPSTISIPRLRAALNGRVITPGDAAYDRTVFYGGFDQRRPAVIIRVTDATEELSTIVNVMPAPPLPFVPPNSTAGWSSWPPSPTPTRSRTASASWRRSGRWRHRSPTWSARCPTRRSSPLLIP